MYNKRPAHEKIAHVKHLRSNISIEMRKISLNGLLYFILANASSMPNQYIGLTPSESMMNYIIAP